MPVARTSAQNYQGFRLKKPNSTGILNNRDRAIRATGFWKSSGPTSKGPATTTFACLFCDHETSVNVKLDRKAGRGQLQCNVCGQHFEASGPHLFDPVDIYCDWSGACEAVSKQEVEEKHQHEQLKLEKQKHRSERGRQTQRLKGHEQVKEYKRKDKLMRQQQQQQQHKLKPPNSPEKQT